MVELGSGCVVELDGNCVVGLDGNCVVKLDCESVVGGKSAITAMTTLLLVMLVQGRSVHHGCHGER